MGQPGRELLSGRKWKKHKGKNDLVFGGKKIDFSSVKITHSTFQYLRKLMQYDLLSDKGNVA